MVNYIKYFTAFLIVLWIVAFWFVFKSGSIISSSKNPQYLDENNPPSEERNKEINTNWEKRIKYAERELTQLEEKIKKNEFIIRNLK
jgi:hypothetical protein